MSPVKECGEFDSLDTRGNAETDEQPVEACLDRTPSHIELFGNLGIVAALQKQLRDLLIASSQPDPVKIHAVPFPFELLLDSAASTAHDRLTSSFGPWHTIQIKLWFLGGY